jgi:hypothetical protein
VVDGTKVKPHRAEARREAPGTACGSKEAPSARLFFGMTESHAPSRFVPWVGGSRRGRFDSGGEGSALGVGFEFGLLVLAFLLDLDGAAG